MKTILMNMNKKKISAVKIVRMKTIETGQINLKIMLINKNKHKTLIAMIKTVNSTKTTTITNQRLV
jgi:hypothetical protein